MTEEQSVSKWETNSSVPDLDKIIKLSEIFEVSLDELVVGNSINGSKVEVNTDKKEEAVENVFNVTVETVTTKEKTISSGRKFVGWLLIVIGTILTGIIMLGQGILEGLTTSVLSVAVFIMLGIVILKKIKHTAIWCFWIVYSYAEFYICSMVGVTENTSISIISAYVNYYLTGAEWFEQLVNAQHNRELYMGCAFGLSAAFIILTSITLFHCYKDKCIGLNKKQLWQLIGGWIGYFVISNLEMSLYYLVVLNDMYIEGNTMRMINLIYCLGVNILLQSLLILNLAAMRRKDKE